MTEEEKFEKWFNEHMFEIFSDKPLRDVLWFAWQAGKNS